VMRLDNWAMVTKKRLTFLTPEMVKNSELHIKNVVFIRIPKRDGECKKDSFFKSDVVRKFDEKTFSTDSEEFVLGSPSKEYLEFTEAVKRGIPIVINWVIGKDCMLSANLYEEGKISYVCEKIVAQNLENRTLVLANGKTVYVVWRNINLEMYRYLKEQDVFGSCMYFPTPEFPFQMDIFEASLKIWEYKGRRPYQLIFNAPNSFSILNEDIRTTRKKKTL